MHGCGFGDGVSCRCNNFFTKLPGKENERMKLKILSLTLLGCLLVSCTAPSYKMYSGPVLSKEQVAILFCEKPAWVDEVDGNGIVNKGFSMGVHKFELSPGHHTLDVRYFVHSGGETYISSEGTISFSFDAQPGRIYDLEASTDPTSTSDESSGSTNTSHIGVWHPFLTDITGKTGFIDYLERHHF
jgi:hypothetical protein